MESLSFLLVVIVLFAVSFFVIYSKYNKTQKKLSEVQDEKKELENRIDSATYIIGSLRSDKEIAEAKIESDAILINTLQGEKEKLDEYTQRFSNIINADEEAKKIIHNAKINEEKADMLLSSATAQSKTLLDESKQKATTMIEVATHRATNIIEEAKQKAIDIAADAYEALGKKREYEKAAQALKNVISGYGDEYIVPSSSVLDGLAEDFGFTEAGKEFKEARATSKALIKNGQAAVCDYVEENRKKTAIAFVVDAFNGKVDTILAKVKVDNFGKLQQEIEDAFILVNINGQAFRNARITEIYKNARLDELRWGVATVVLREQEREEQRAIKERIREEERAKREYEKALKEASKDEEKLQKALDIARKELESASAEQKQKYEAQLADLNAKLIIAEEKSKRAQSMAELTRSGHIYVISNIGSFGENVFKIGMTRRLEPLDRVRELGDASVPFAFDVHAMIYSEDAPSLENTLHKKFDALRVNKVNIRKEFFGVSLQAIQEVTEELGLQTNFTLLAQAAEYRESLALAKTGSLD